MIKLIINLSILLSFSIIIYGCDNVNNSANKDTASDSQSDGTDINQSTDSATDSQSDGTDANQSTDSATDTETSSEVDTCSSLGSCWDKSTAVAPCLPLNDLKDSASKGVTSKMIENYCNPYTYVTYNEILNTCEQTSGITCKQTKNSLNSVIIENESAWNTWNLLCGTDPVTISDVDWENSTILMQFSDLRGGCCTGNCASSEYSISVLPLDGIQVDFSVWDPLFHFAINSDTECDGSYYIAAALLVTTDMAQINCFHPQPCPDECQ